MTASTPRSSIFLAIFTFGITGNTFIPASFSLGIYSLGVPAPVVTIFTPSSMTTSMISGTFLFKNIKLTANGLSVNSFTLWISSRTCSGVSCPEANTPKPPALETAATNPALATSCIAP